MAIPRFLWPLQWTWKEFYVDLPSWSRSNYFLCNINPQSHQRNVHFKEKKIISTVIPVQVRWTSLNGQRKYLFPQRPSKIQMKKTDPGKEGRLTPKWSLQTNNEKLWEMSLKAVRRKKKKKKKKCQKSWNISPNYWDAGEKKKK